MFFSLINQSFNFFETISFIGDVRFFIIMFLFIYWLYNKKDAFLYTAVYMLGLCFNSLLKTIIKKPRPNNSQDVLGYAMPSGHAYSISTQTTMIGYNVFKKNNIPTKKKILVLIDLCICTIFVCISRVVLNVHDVFDVVVGSILGIIITLGLMYVVNIIYQFIKNKNLTLYFAILCVVSLVATLIICYYTNVFTSYSNSQVVIFSTFFIGAIIGSLLEHKFVKYDCADSVKNLIYKALIGFGLMFVLYLILGVSQSKFVFICYTVLGFCGTYLIPLILRNLFRKEQV